MLSKPSSIGLLSKLANEDGKSERPEPLLELKLGKNDSYLKPPRPDGSSKSPQKRILGRTLSLPLDQLTFNSMKSMNKQNMIRHE